MIRIIFLFILVWFVSCKEQTVTHSKVEIKDSIMKRYFQVVDSLSFYDTLDSKFSILKAYYINDTAYLKSAYEDIAELLDYRNEFLRTHVCKEPLPLNLSNYIEAYRFTYRAAFCDKAVNVTVGKTKDSIILDLYLYEQNYDLSECKTVDHVMKQLNLNDWDTLESGLRFSDFWGLKEDNGSRGFDGSSLTVTGYERPMNAFKGNFKSIYRWAGETTAIGLLFKKMLELSKIRVECFHF